MHANGNDEFYTPKQAAAILKVHLVTMYRYAKQPPQRGGPPKRKFSSRNIRFPKRQFLVWAGISAPEK